MRSILLQKGLMRLDGLPVDDFLILPGVGGDYRGRAPALYRCRVALPERKTGSRGLRHDPQRGGLAIPPASVDLFRAGIRFSTLETLTVDAIEVFNAATTLRRYNRYAFKYAQIRGLPMTAASDAHHAAAVGTAYTIINTDDFSVKGILAQILKSNELTSNTRPLETACVKPGTTGCGCGGEGKFPSSPQRTAALTATDFPFNPSTFQPSYACLHHRRDRDPRSHRLRRI